MDKTSMTVANECPATRPGRTGLSSAHHPLSPQGDLTEERRVWESSWGRKDISHLRSFLMIGTNFANSGGLPRGGDPKGRRFPEAPGGDGLAGRGCPGNPGRASPSSFPSPRPPPPPAPGAEPPPRLRLLPGRVESECPRSWRGGRQATPAYRLLLLDP